jgi:hypothetical protein
MGVAYTGGDISFRTDVNTPFNGVLETSYLVGQFKFNATAHAFQHCCCLRSTAKQAALHTS